MKIAVLGAGNMGSWLIGELAKNHKICVYDLDQARPEKMRNIRILRNYSELEEFQPALLVNAVSLQNTVEAFKSATPYLPENCIISDIASVKGKIPEYYQNCGFRFVSVHPMFGPTSTNIRQLKNENAVIIRESDEEGIRFYRDFFTSLKINIFTYSFDEHDQMIAYSLTLPFASTMVFAACMDNRAVPGTTFKKHLEIAKGLLAEDDFLLAEILFNSYSLPQLEKVTSRLEFLKHVIREKDLEEVMRFFDRLRKNIQ